MRQLDLYEVKDSCIKKMLIEVRLIREGYHIQKTLIDECTYKEVEYFDHELMDYVQDIKKVYTGAKIEMTTYLLLVKFEQYTFHLPIDEEQLVDLRYLGEMGVVPADRRSSKMKYIEAIVLLKKIYMLDLLQ